MFSWVTARRAVPVGGSIDIEIVLLCGAPNRAADSHPVAHSCFNQLELPAFSSVDALRQKLIEALVNDDKTGGRFDIK